MEDLPDPPFSSTNVSEKPVFHLIPRFARLDLSKKPRIWKIRKLNISFLFERSE